METGKIRKLWYLAVIIELLSVHSFGQELKMEAENATLTGVTVSTSATGYSGTGYVTGFDNAADKIEFNFTSEAGIYSVFIGYRTPNGEKGYDLTVNEISGSGMFPGPNNEFEEIEAGKFMMTDGSQQNTIVIGYGWGWFDIDYVRIEPSSVSPPSRPSNILIDENATQSTRALFSYLTDIYGTKVISGQQDLDEIEYIESVTGKSPAMGCFDLIEYSPSRIEHGSNPGNSVETWIEWQKEGDAIVSLCWHWNAPGGLLDTPDHEWWRGFYTHATTFDLEAALADEGSEDYQFLLRDMDSIAAQLKKFQAEDIPVLWRPLHEASGGWFWWGAKGAEPYQELWQLMYDRYTNFHNLHNLIWVSTHGDNSWYTGDDYVDIVGLDIYTDSSSNMSGEWELAQDMFNGRKMVALSESGTLPNPENVNNFCTWWSYFSIWAGEFLTDIYPSYLSEVYNHEDIITLDELPDWRNYNDIENVTCDFSSDEIVVFPNPAGHTASISYTLAEPSDAYITIYNTAGVKVQSVFHSSLSAGSYTSPLPCSSLIPGIYLVCMQTDSFMADTVLVISKN